MGKYRCFKYFNDTYQKNVCEKTQKKQMLYPFSNHSSAHPNAAYPSGQANAFPGPPYASLSAFGDGEKQRKKKGKKHRHA